jgi:hypothetical protein
VNPHHCAAPRSAITEEDVPSYLDEGALVDDRLDGNRIVEESNWTGRVVVASRAPLSEGFTETNSPAPACTCCPVLTTSDRQFCTSAKADVLGERLRNRNHASRKSLWTRLVVFTSTDETSTRRMSATWSPGP